MIMAHLASVGLGRSAKPNQVPNQSLVVELTCLTLTASPLSHPSHTTRVSGCNFRQLFWSAQISTIDRRPHFPSDYLRHTSCPILVFTSESETKCSLQFCTDVLLAFCGNWICISLVDTFPIWNRTVVWSESPCEIFCLESTTAQIKFIETRQDAIVR